MVELQLIFVTYEANFLNFDILNGRMGMLW